MTLDVWLRTTKTPDNEFARRIGISRVTLYRFKTGQRIPNRAVMGKIVRETKGDVTPDSFFAPPSPSTEEAA